MKATYKKHTLQFKRPSGTSRGVLHTKDTYFIVIEHEGKKGIGECGLLKGLSIDDRPDYESKLAWVCANISESKKQLFEQLEAYPSITMGLEMAYKSLASSEPFKIFPSAFYQGKAAIPINGLVWMGDKAFMKTQIAQKIAEGFTCIKMKIGAIDFDTEIALLKAIRKQFTATEIELRVDANGAFTPDTALEKLQILSNLDIHSIEQPIKQGQWELMAALCDKTPLPIALDEELIGVFSLEQKRDLLTTIKPQYCILKPSLLGGFAACDQWIALFDDAKIGWWITSALESDIGLNAIAQYTFTKNVTMPQGLGTGSLYTNNIPSPLQVMEGTLTYNPKLNWSF